MLHGLIREDTSASGSQQKRPKAKEPANAKAPPLDRIPLPPVPPAVALERRQMQREAQKKTKINADNPPSVCLYTLLNAPHGVCTATFSEGLGSVAVGYGNSAISVMALAARAYRQLKSAPQLEALMQEQEFDHLADEMYDTNTTADIELNGHSGAVHALSFSCDTRLLLSGSADATVRLWNLDLRRCIVAYALAAPVWDAAFCSRGVYFAAACASRAVAVYSTERPTPLRLFADAASAAADTTCVDWHPNCNYVVGGGDDGALRVWDLLDGACVQTLTGHAGAVHSAKVSPDGRLVATASDDGTLRVWDLAAQKALAVQEVAPMPHCVPIQFSRDAGSVIAVGAPDAAVSFFSIDTAVVSYNYTHETRSNVDGFHLMTYPTKRTNFLDFQFARKNVVVGVGVTSQ